MKSSVWLMFPIWSSLVTLTLSEFSSNHLLSEVKGNVGGGNYTFYSISEKVAVRLDLTTTSGDADLYVSETVTEPSYDLDSHSLSSVSCGVDELVIAKDFGRPVYIAVYGHPRKERSGFVLRAYSHADEYNPFDEDIADYDNFHNGGDSSSSSSADNNPPRSKRGGTEQEGAGHEEDEEPLWLTIINQFFLIILEILL